MKSSAILLVLFSALTVSSAFADPTNLAFSRDMRAVDGALVSVSVSENASGTYDLVLKTEGRLGKSEESLGENMSCEISPDASAPTEVKCSRDLRRVDGALVEVKIIAEESGEYSVTSASEYRGKSESKEIASGLKLAK